MALTVIIKIDIDSLCEVETLCQPLDLENFIEDDELMEFLKNEDDEYPTEDELIDILSEHKGKYLVINQSIKQNSSGSWSWKNHYSFEEKEK